MRRVQGARVVHADERARRSRADQEEQHADECQRRLARPDEHGDERPVDERRHPEHQIAAAEGEAGDRVADERGRQHGADDQQREHRGRGRDVIAERRSEERVAPEHPHRLRRGSAQQVRPEAQLRAGAGDARAQPRPGRAGRDLLRHRRTSAGADHSDADEDGEQRHPGRDQERDVPSDRVEQERERDGRDQLAGRPDHADPLRQLRQDPAAEPVRQQAQHRHERERVARADQHASGDREADVVGEGEQHLPERHDGGASDQQDPRAEAVDEHADRDLQRRIRRHLHHGDGREGGGAHPESISRLDADDAEGRALRDRGQVHDDGASEHHPGTPGVHVGFPNAETRCTAERLTRPGTERAPLRTARRRVGWRGTSPARPRSCPPREPRRGGRRTAREAGSPPCSCRAAPRAC